MAEARDAAAGAARTSEAASPPWPAVIFDAAVLRGLDARARREISEAGRLLTFADGETIFDGGFEELRRAAGPRPEGSAADPENDFVRFLRQRGH